jgi:hypothetical protein
MRKKPPTSQYGDVDPTVVDGPLGRPDMQKPASTAGAPTAYAKPVPKAVQQAAAPIQVISKKEQSAPIQVISKKEQSAPIQAISMKTPGAQQDASPANPPTPILPRPKLRAVSEVKPAQQPQNFGNVAQPYDAKEARARAMREYVIWGCLAVILASAIALVVWFVAR